MHQLFMFLRGFSPAHKNCKKVFSDKILYRWYRYITLQNYLIKLTPNVLIKSIAFILDMYTVHDDLGIYFKVVILT